MGKVLKIREVGEPILNKISKEIDIKNINQEILDIIDDLKATLEFGKGYGIAAPQIGVNKRIVVVGAKKEDVKYNDAEEIPITAMINPSWKEISNETDIQYEGCMSVPSIRGKVKRFKNIELTYYDETGKQIIKQLHGFFARLVQHECDHLDGIIFLEKVKEKNGFATSDNVNKYNLRENNMYIRDEIKQYIENEIFKIYNQNEKGHGIEHIKYVIRRSLDFAKRLENINYEMVYVIAAYHDIAHHIDAENHEIISAKILIEDKKIKEFFTEEQILIMKEAIEDHRSSLETEPRSIYGKIVSSADRNTDVETTLKRSYSYNKNHSPELTQDEVIEKCRKFLLKKFGKNGYAREKMYFEDEEYNKYLEDITKLVENRELFKINIKGVNGI